MLLRFRYLTAGRVEFLRATLKLVGFVRMNHTSRSTWRRRVTLEKLRIFKLRFVAHATMH